MWGTFRFWDEDENEYGIWLPAFSENTEKFYSPDVFLFISSIGCSVIHIAGNWAFLQIKKCQNCYRVLDLFWRDNIFTKPRSKMTKVSRFSRQYDAGLGALIVVLWENLVIVLFLILEWKGPYFENGKNYTSLFKLCQKICWYHRPKAYWTVLSSG